MLTDMPASKSWPVLTIRNPWCWAILHGGKTVENRSWKTSYRGPILLHAGARSGWDTAGAESPLVQEAWLAYLRTGPAAPVPLTSTAISLTRGNALMAFGAVVAVAELAGCHLSPDFGGTCGATRPLCSPWAVRDQYHWLLEDVRPLAEPVPCRGALRLWRLPDDVEAAVRMQVESRDVTATQPGKSVK
jgi:ASCH domain